MCGEIGEVGVRFQDLGFRTLGEYLTHGARGIQHRGQDSAGLETFDGKYHLLTGEGLIDKALPEHRRNSMDGDAGLFQVRYVVSGGDQYPQPMVEKFAVAHNGQMWNYTGLFDLVLQSDPDYPYKNPSDTRLFSSILEEEGKKQESIDNAVIAALDKALPTYSLVVQHENTLYAARDPHGVWDLFYAKIGEGYVVASEDQSLLLMGAKPEDIKEVEPGTLLRFRKGEDIHQWKLYSGDSKKCIFQRIYFNRPKLEHLVPTVYGEGIVDDRVMAGKILARHDMSQGLPVDEFAIVPVMGGGLYSAVGYLAEVKRVTGTQSRLSFGLQKKYREIRHFLARSREERRGTKGFVGKPTEIQSRKLVVVDDSTVRLDTMYYRVIPALRLSGADEVHVRNASAPVIDKCRYGMAIRSRDELIAARMQDRLGEDFIRGIDDVLTLRFFGLGYSLDRVIDLVGEPLDSERIKGLVDQSILEGRNFLFDGGELRDEVFHGNDFSPSRVSVAFLTLEEVLEAYGRDDACAACLGDDLWTPEHNKVVT
ncbi:hypothetical protein GOV09_07030 [Candidatus Woesearchaeota archaeon]|nr:hypothetical protein [Candidatus Woesearchaeota archaeon]